MTLILSIIALAAAEPQTVTHIDFESVELTAEMARPSLTLVTGDRQPAKPDILILDLRQFVLDIEREKAEAAGK
jgi:hypothetical protein